MREACLALVLALLFAAPILAQTRTAPDERREPRTFYVRQTVGDDANDGLSPGSAWRTLSMLEDAMRAGDTAYVGPGLYREKITVGHGGTATARITFIADTSGAHTSDPPGVVMISGADEADESAFVRQLEPGLYMAPVPWIVRGAVEMDGPQYRYATVRGSMIDVTEPASLWYDYDARRVFLRTSDGRPPTAHELELIRRDYGIVTYGKRFVTVIGFTFRHMAVAGINFEAGAHGGVAINNTCYGGWHGIRVAASADAFVGGNTLFRNDNSGVYFFRKSANGYAVGNVAYQNSKGLRWGVNASGGVALANVLFAGRETGISIENADDIRITRNVMVDNAIAQLRVKESRYNSGRNCFEKRAKEQMIAKIDFYELYPTLAEYRQAVEQDLDSVESCGPLPGKIDVRKLHARVSTYAERAGKALDR